MTTILYDIYNDDLISPSILCNLEDPQRPEEQRIVTQLRVVSEAAAKALRDSIAALAGAQAERSFYIGVRFGAQLMAELLENCSP